MGKVLYRVEWTSQNGKKKYADVILKQTADAYAKLLFQAHGIKATIKAL